MLRTIRLKTGKLERERLRLGLTRTEFGRRCGISNMTRTKLFRGEGVDFGVARKVAAVLNMDLVALMASQVGADTEPALADVAGVRTHE